jgi:sortase A
MQGMNRGRIVDILSAILIVTGIGLLSYVSYQLVAGSAGNKESLAAFEAASKSHILPPAEAGRTPLPAETRDWSTERIEKYQAANAGPNANVVPEGIVRIPSIALEVPVFPGTAETTLARGAGRIEGTPVLGQGGNSGIAAHRDSYFRALKDVQLGDPIEIETMGGVQQYKIVDLSIVGPDAVHVLEPTELDTITLVTCYPFYFVGNAPQRYIVRAEKI